MATWTVEQKVEVWYKTTVEADTPEEAIELAGEDGDWVRAEESEWTDNFWLMNEETTEQYTCYNGLMIQEG